MALRGGRAQGRIVFCATLRAVVSGGVRSKAVGAPGGLTGDRSDRHENAPRLWSMKTCAARLLHQTTTPRQPFGRARGQAGGHAGGAGGCRFGAAAPGRVGRSGRVRRTGGHAARWSAGTPARPGGGRGRARLDQVVGEDGRVGAGAPAREGRGGQSPRASEQQGTTWRRTAAPT